MLKKARLYKDTIATYDNKGDISNSRTNPILFLPGFKDAYDRYVFIDVVSCDCEELKHKFNIYRQATSLPLYEIRPSNFPAVTDIYDVYGSFDGQIYHEQTETKDYYKIARIYLEVQNAYSDKIKKRSNLMHNLKRIQLKLVNKIKELKGDGALDICLYHSDYQELGKETSGKRTTILYSDKMLLTATVIKFKIGFLPDKKYILKSGEDALNAVETE